MALYLQLLEGKDAGSARPVIATSDPRLIGAVMALLPRLVGGSSLTAEDIAQAISLFADPAMRRP